ncbi:MAG: Sulfide dehydrogenase [flavocytochrome C] flavoprotein chain precursor (EC [uncultured Thiotrichaceae bacterium]|uniref:Sulfide dehydrogenase [flavocytochrome C] flavoprotein chain (EC) n=1 Tax=uncultured Thiotrichaceae bacterium TaxID=298394 RepID=A0A6S6STD2_9GAMM|nr:MAG: Sulfide dehydrogenase [flavocytochrome C] flavoprotein chain precursor (EC [uncultured Thiotrichaceae bacterium]
MNNQNHNKKDGLSRRQMLKLLGASALTYGLLGASTKAFSNTAPHIVIVGGGIGGAAAAKYLRLLNAEVKITVIEPNSQYIFCPGSNEVIPGWVTLEDLMVTYTTLKTRYKVNVIHDKATTIDYDKKQVKLEKGDVLSYHKLIVSPGPTHGYHAIEGFSKELADGDFPAAYDAGRQTMNLRNQILAMKKGGTVIIAPPENDYRCPPAPYERASFVAAMLKENNPTGKILILDAKDEFVLSNNYIPYWEKTFGYGTDNSMIEWVQKKKGGEVVKLDASNHAVVTADGQTHKGDVINIIPPEAAGQFALKNDLADDRWCPVEFQDFSSTRHKDVYVIGDSVDGSPMPKTGYIASNQARVVVQAINDELHGREVGTPFIVNDCVAMAGHDYGMALSTTFRYAGKGERLKDLYYVQGLETNPAKQLIRQQVAENWQRTFRKDIFE